MKSIYKYLGIFILYLMVSACNRTAENTLSDTEKIRPISSTEIADLLYLIEEEKLARDTYVYLYQKWNVQQFNNIKNSEQTHMNAVENLLKKYKISYKILAAGNFSNPELQSLYTQLTTQGNASKIEALKVGATIEDVDIKDLEKMAAETRLPDLNAVYSNLMCGSRNHMRAFSSSLKNLGVTYVPQFITQAEYDAIINSTNEQCGN